MTNEPIQPKESAPAMQAAQELSDADLDRAAGGAGMRGIPTSILRTGKRGGGGGRGGVGGIGGIRG